MNGFRATDRDLLILEPNLFRDLIFLAQRRISSSDAAISGTTLQSNSSDFEAKAVDAGSIVTVDTVPLEVIERLSPTQLTVSLLRPLSSATPIPPTPGVNLTLRVYSFEPQITVMHERLLERLRAVVDDGDTGLDDAALEDAVVNPWIPMRVEALGALQIIFEAALDGDAGDPVTELKASLYRERYRFALDRATIRLDLDGDGLVDATRTLRAGRLVRV
ncbi:MAG: hypothetical protein ACF8PN_08460 [Phycisphaerales bacterium]